MPICIKGTRDQGSAKRIRGGGNKGIRGKKKKTLFHKVSSPQLQPWRRRKNCTEMLG
jgi:hypothetical protein